MTFVNPKIERYHHKAIREFSETNRLIVGNVAKGYSSIEYSWVADFLFKNTGNKSINPHIGYIDFVSDKDITYQEYGNISEIYNNYTFFSNYVRNILSNNSFELSTKQYSKIGQRYSEFDLIEYVNASEKLILDGIEGNLDPSPGETIINHTFYRSPAYVASGYSLNGESLVTPVYQKEYIFAFDKDVGNGLSGLNNIGMTLFEKSFILRLDNYSNDLLGGNLGSSRVSSFLGEVKRICNYKLDVDNKFSYFEPNLDEWVMYYNDTNHYKGNTYYPYYGEVLFYEIPSEIGSQGKYLQRYIEDYGGSVNFFPEIIQRGIFEPAKIIANWSVSKILSNGAMAFNPSNHLGQPDDQSRIVYNVCRRQIKTTTPGVYNINDTYSGIDIDTERNRRYSAIVMTEPYMVTEPIGGGEIVEYCFVNENGNKVQFVDENDFINNPNIFLKIKAPIHIFTELDKLLYDKQENTDIINVLTIKDPLSNISAFNAAGTYYDRLGTNSTVFFQRQDDCLDDLIGGKVGFGTHKEFYIDYISEALNLYSNNRIQVNGAGFVSKTIADSSGNIIDVENEINLYCSNYVAVNCPDSQESDPTITIPNSVTELLLDNSVISRVTGSELFKPMIKLSGMNGYVKIMNRNNHFKSSRSTDGSFEFVFNVEFPYCPGSYLSRVEMDFSTSNYKGFIYKKIAYINAGSHADYGGYYDNSNDRFVPYRDDSFTKHLVLKQYDVNNTVSTDPHTKGGGLSSILSTPKKTVKYPTDIVWSRIDDWLLFSLTKPTINRFERYGTYEINIQEPSVEDEFSRDVKVLCMADNRQWRFDQDKYISFVGRENPALVCQISVETIYKDFSQFQKEHGSIPDAKRWISAYFSGFANVMSQDFDEDVATTEKINTMGDVNDLTIGDSKSDLIIEIWDSESDIGNGKKGNWRPFLYNGFDYNKISDKLIVDNIFINEQGGIQDPNEVVADPKNIWEAWIGYSDGQFFDVFPEKINYGVVDEDVLDGESNLVLYDTEDNRSFHIVYIERVLVDTDSLGRELYKIYFRYNPSTDGSLKTASHPSDTAPYQILFPKRMLSKDTRFSFDSIKYGFGAPSNQLKRFVDLKDSVSTLSDIDRYSINEKLFFRVRIAKNKQFPASYTDEDNSELIFLGENVSLAGDEWVNNPWRYDSMGSFDTAFNWSKIRILEEVRKLGLSHFRCSSK